MTTTDFDISGKINTVSIDGSPEFKFGNDIIYSNENTDIVYYQPWYKKGYTSVPFLTDEEFNFVKEGLTDAVKNIIFQECGLASDNFSLEKYHHLVTSQDNHMKVVSKTRDLFSKDFNFPIDEMIPKFEKILGFELTDVDPKFNEKLHIIVRINRPKSNDFNPPHKDIYEEVDKNNYIPPFVNLWIPIAGVTSKSSLPMAPESHLLNENEIERTFEGSIVDGKPYRVRMVKQWGGLNKLERAIVKDGEVLFFSSHLIHGLAINDEEDQTRVALEFRLFKK